MTAANSSNPDFWTVMLTLYGFIAIVLFGMWFLTRRTLRRDRFKYAPPAELPDPELGQRQGSRHLAGA
jgi:hypothetical protein